MNTLTFVIFGLFLLSIAPAYSMPEPHRSGICGPGIVNVDPLTLPLRPRTLDRAATFQRLVNYLHRGLIIQRGAPGFVVGLSGTDSILVFLAAAKAFENAGRPERVVGIHYGTPHSGDPFQSEVIPWLRQQAPKATILIDDSFDTKRDGLRWGALLDFSVIQDVQTRALRAPADRYWVLGTRNASEEYLGTYSNISNGASVQPIVDLWKSEVLSICAFLGVPTYALQKSCQVDCVCGRRELPALHIPEVDALIMTRLGLISPQYIESTIPLKLREQLNQFIDEQEAGSAFKKAIPYRPQNTAVTLADGELISELDLAKRAIFEGLNDTRSVARVLSRIILGKRADLAGELVSSQSPRRDLWLPEALVLFNTEGIRSPQISIMVEKVFNVGVGELRQNRRISRVAGRLGNYGFSFAQWRFLSQSRAQSPALAEDFGMTKLVRPTDTYAPDTHPNIADKDFWGKGFVNITADWYIEYRRAYILISRLSATDPVTILIRNSSYYFGRDRLSDAIAISWKAHSPENLIALSPENFAAFGFIAVDKIFSSHEGPEITKRLDSIEGALGRLDSFNREMDSWLRGPGFAKLLSFLDTQPRLWLGFVQGSALSWGLKEIAPLTPDLVADLRSAGSFDGFLNADEPNTRLVLMSGPGGDYP